MKRPPVDLNSIAMYYLGIPVMLSEQMNGFRSLFDPKYAVNEPHATLVFPFPAALMSQDLSEHFAAVVARYKSQEIIASGFYITSCGHIFYTFDDESEKLLSAMHEQLYQHPALQARKEQGRAFIPHITIGKFENEQKVPHVVRSILPELCEPMSFMFDRVRLYGILHEPGKRLLVQEYVVGYDSSNTIE